MLFTILHIERTQKRICFYHLGLEYLAFPGARFFFLFLVSSIDPNESYLFIIVEYMQACFFPLYWLPVKSRTEFMVHLLKVWEISWHIYFPMYYFFKFILLKYSWFTVLYDFCCIAKWFSYISIYVFSYSITLVELLNIILLYWIQFPVLFIQ